MKALLALLILVSSTAFATEIKCFSYFSRDTTMLTIDTAAGNLITGHDLSFMDSREMNASGINAKKSEPGVEDSEFLQSANFKRSIQTDTITNDTLDIDLKQYARYDLNLTRYGGKSYSLARLFIKKEADLVKGLGIDVWIMRKQKNEPGLVVLTNLKCGFSNRGQGSGH